jgi:hypothetical protein
VGKQADATSVGKQQQHIPTRHVAHEGRSTLQHIEERGRWNMFLRSYTREHEGATT